MVLATGYLILTLEKNKMAIDYFEILYIDENNPRVDILKKGCFP